MFQFYVVSCYIAVCCVIILFCVHQCCLVVLYIYIFNVMLFSNIILLFYNVTTFFCILLSPFVTLYHCSVRYNVVLCTVMLFCNNTTLFYIYYSIVVCLIILFCNVIMLFFALLCRFVSYYVVLYYYNIALFLIMLFCIL